MPPWPIAPAIVFAVMLVSLTAVALISWLAPVRILTGLPEDPDVAAAKDLVASHVTVGGRDLRFVSSLGISSGRSEPEADPVVPDRAERSARAEAHLRVAQRRLRKDVRLIASLGHLALATDRLEVAERRYRKALDRAPNYGEARLGLGVALARRAETTGDEPAARTLRLLAIAQFAAVPERDPCHGIALANRIVLLRQVGRSSEADRLAASLER